MISELEFYDDIEIQTNYISKINNINIPVAVRIIVGLALVIVARQVLLKRPEMSELIVAQCRSFHVLLMFLIPLLLLLLLLLPMFDQKKRMCTNMYNPERQQTTLC